MILVDGGSTDDAKKKKLENTDARTRLVELLKNYGQSMAMTAGIDHAIAKYVTMIDGDLQNDPTDIPFMLLLAKKEDWNVVAANRQKRKDGMFL